MKRSIWRISLVFWAVIGITSPLLAQSPLDSMERLLPTLTGQKKIDLAGELAYQYCYVNTDKAFHYGKMELAAKSMTNASSPKGSMVVWETKWNRDRGA